MLAILRKVQADLFNRRLASLLVMLTILSASALLTLTVTTLGSLDHAFERSFNELNGAHLWLFFDRSLTSQAAVRRIEQLPGVQATTGLQISQVTRAVLGQEKVPVSVRVVSPEPPDVNRLRLSSGRFLQPGDHLGVLVDKRLAEQYNIRPGNIIQVDTGWGEKPLTVAGLVFNPIWDIYRANQPPYIYVLENTFRKYFPDDLVWDWSLGLRLTDPESTTGILRSAEDAARKKAIVDHTDWHSVRDAYLFGAQLNTVLLIAFGLFSLGAAAFILANSISGAVLAQFHDIGVLKALGFTGREVAAVYLGQNFVIGAVGAALGLLAGIFLAPLPLSSLSQALESAPRPVYNPFLLALVWLGVQVVVLGAAFLPAWRGARTNTIRAISTGFELPASRASLLARLALRAHLPVPVVLGAKNAFARRGRAVLTLFSLLLGVVALVFSAALNSVLDGYLRDPSLVGIVYDAWVSREEISVNSAWRALEGAPGVAAVLAHASAEVKTENGQSFRIHAQQGDLTRFPYKLEAGRLPDPNLPGEMLIGVGLQHWLGLQVGDSLRLKVNEKKQLVHWRVVGVYREPSDNGQMALVTLDTLRAVDRQAEPDTFYLRLQAGADLQTLRDDLKTRAGDHLSLAVINKEAAGLTQFRLTMLALAVVLSGIALLSVLNTTVLTMREQMHEIGAYKTLGMTPGQVVGMVLTSGGILGACAGVLGAPVGVLLVRLTLSTLGTAYGFGSFDWQINLFSLGLPALAAVLVGLLGSVIPARWAGRLQVVEVLLYE